MHQTEPTSGVEYVITDTDGGKKEVYVPGDAQRQASIQRAGELLAKIRANKEIERKMLRAAIKLESLAGRKERNRKRDKTAKKARKRNR